MNDSNTLNESKASGFKRVTLWTFAFVLALAAFTYWHKSESQKLVAEVNANGEIMAEQMEAIARDHVKANIDLTPNLKN